MLIKSLITGTSIIALMFLVLSLDFKSWLNPDLPAVNTDYIREVEQPVVSEPALKENQIKVKRLDLRDTNNVFLTDEVNSRTINAAIDEIVEFNKDNNKPIYVLIDSPGGSVIDGARLITAMQNSKNPVYTVCLQLCASMGAMILEFGAKRYAVDRSIIMFHPASLSTMISEELDKVVSRLSFLKRYVDKMDVYVAKRSGQTYEQFKAKSTQEWWIDAADAYKEKLVDSVVSVDLPSMSVFDFDNIVKEDFMLEN